jgi:hypothetical protein
MIEVLKSWYAGRKTIAKKQTHQPILLVVGV